MDHFNLLDSDNDIIGDYVKKDNNERIQKICKKYVKLNKNKIQIKNQEEEDGCEARKEYCKKKY
jgi:hypothetical protein